MKAIISVVSASLLLAVVPWSRALGPSDIRSLNPALWHEPARLRTPELKRLNRELTAAIAAGEVARVQNVAGLIQAALGPDLSMPEEATDYVERGAGDSVSRQALTAAWLADCQKHLGADPWDTAQRRLNSGHVPARLRDSVRMAEAYLRTAQLPGLEAQGESFRARALAGFSYVRSVQTSSGVFGYPYDPDRTDRLGSMAVQLVLEGQKQGKKMVEGVWLIDDLGRGDLQFDNGVSGLAMLEAYDLSKDKSFLDSARRAGDYALKAPLVANWNYNSFSARLLGRLYLVTHEPRYLAACKTKFEVGVLPGQIVTGRWEDPHNARTQYHSILCTALVDYVIVLERAGDPRGAEVRRRAEWALDNLALQTETFGPSNVFELLGTEALCRGCEVLGARPHWRQAAKDFLLGLTPAYRSKLEQRVGHLPEGLPAGLLATSMD